MILRIFRGRRYGVISDGNKHHALAQGGQGGLDPRAVFGEAQDWPVQTAARDFDRYSEAYTNLNLSKESIEADRARYKVTKSTAKKDPRQRRLIQHPKQRRCVMHGVCRRDGQR